MYTCVQYTPRRYERKITDRFMIGIHTQVLQFCQQSFLAAADAVVIYFIHILVSCCLVREPSDLYIRPRILDMFTMALDRKKS
jgi:hypothetical protein